MSILWILLPSPVELKVPWEDKFQNTLFAYLILWTLVATQMYPHRGASLARVSVAPYLRLFSCLPIREILVVTWPYVCPPDRPIYSSVRTTRKPVWNVILSSQRVNLQRDTAHPCYGQLTAVKTGYPLASIMSLYDGLSCPPIEVTCFSEDLHWKVTSFQLVAGSSSIFQREIDQLFLITEKEEFPQRAVSW